MRLAPISKIPGEKTCKYQPSLKLPEPFAKNIFKKEDVTNLSKSSRKKWTKNAKNYKLKAICLLVSDSILTERNKKREGKTINDEVIDGMKRRLRLPFDDEFDEIIYKVEV